jgi:ribosomal protein S18 acetylase RimI-like enzyme
VSLRRRQLKHHTRSVQNMQRVVLTLRYPTLKGEDISLPRQRPKRKSIGPQASSRGRSNHEQKRLSVSAPTIRRASAQDLAQIVALLRDDALGKSREQSTDSLPVSYYHAFQAIALDPNHEIFVSVLEPRVVGCLQLSFLPGLSHLGAWRAQIESVRVLESRRRQGVGKSMIAFAIKEATSRGCKIVQLTMDKRRTGSRQFYEALGFQATHEGMKRELR